MHFHYLVEAFGGLATVARDFAEHHRQLADRAAGATDGVEPRSRALRRAVPPPARLGRPVSPILTAEIERAGVDPKSPGRPMLAVAAAAARRC